MKSVHSHEKWHDLVGEHLCGAESLGEEHHLSDQLTIRLSHGQASEQLNNCQIKLKDDSLTKRAYGLCTSSHLFEIVRQVRPSRVARIHRDEDTNVRIHVQPLANKINCHFATGAHRLLQQIQTSDSKKVTSSLSTVHESTFCILVVLCFATCCCT